MNNNSKPWLFALLGLVVGAVLTYFLMEASSENNAAVNPQIHDQASERQSDVDNIGWMFDVSDSSLKDIKGVKAKGMDATEAFSFFTTYQGTDPNSPNGILRTTYRTEDDDIVRTAAIGMILDKDELFKKLDDAAALRNPTITLSGYYMIFAKEDNNQHRMLFMGVYDDPADPSKKRLMLPLNPTDKTAIYDWIRPCPDNCPEESKKDSLWTEDYWLDRAYIPPTGGGTTEPASREK